MALPTISTSQFTLEKAEAAAILDEARRYSLVQRYGTQVPMSLGGTNVPVFSNQPKGGFVGEGQKKPVAGHTVSNTTMARRKWAVIVPMSAEVARANPSGIIQHVGDSVAISLAKAIDDLALTGAEVSGAAYVNQSTKEVAFGTEASTYLDVNAGLKLLVDDKKTLTHFIFDDAAEPVLNAAVDTAGRPLFLDSTTGEANSAVRPGRILGRPAAFVRDVATVDGDDTVLGYGGDFANIRWGMYSALSVDVSTQGTITDPDSGTLISAYENNLVLFRFEAELGVLVHDPQAFVKFLAEAPAES